ncbi:MAG TPA: AMP-binding protein, partial [Candidatus Limnocylindrales bacterium]|nr:AMP-binding protein [Candidatus Limnocylindrales bacterium]
AVWLRGAAFTILPPPGRTGREAHLAKLRAILADSRPGLVIGDGIPGAVTVESIVAQAVTAPMAEAVQPGPEDLAVLQYTSGSTSNPRGVPVTHGNLAANLDAIEAAIGSDLLDPATNRWLSWLPLYHDMGLIGFLTLPMTRGCPLVLQSPLAFALRPAAWLERLTKDSATVTGAPNFAYALMAQLLEVGCGADLSSVKRMFSGGEPIDAAMMRRFTAAARPHGLDPNAVVAAYGLAESTLAVSFCPLAVDEVNRESLEREGFALPSARGRALVRVGRAVSGTQIRITNSEGEQAAVRVVGHIEVCGPSVVAGYWGEPPRPTPWLRTGDLGYLTGDGELVVCGRAKDVLFAAGRNIYPQDVEAAAVGVPGVRAGGAAAFGIPASYELGSGSGGSGGSGGFGMGDRLVVAVEARAGDDAGLRRAVALAVVSQTGMAPADVVTLRFGRLPKTSSGKLRRAETRRRYLAGELSPDRSGLVKGSVQ